MGAKPSDLYTGAYTHSIDSDEYALPNFKQLLERTDLSGFYHATLC